MNQPPLGLRDESWRVPSTEGTPGGNGTERPRRSVLYVTAQVPWGLGESFVLTEALAVSRSAEVLMYPLRPGRRVWHDEARELKGRALRLSLMSPWALACLARHALVAPGTVWALIRLLWNHSRSPRIFLKNLAVLPKAFWLASRIGSLRIQHIHAHWAATCSTLAYCVSFLTGLAWSLTAHRWDIDEDNMLAEKARTASFVRVISERGRQLLSERIPADCADKVKVIHMGVVVPEPGSAPDPGDGPCPGRTFACVSYLLEVKGHRFLLEACQVLARRGVPFHCWIIGDGPLAGGLKEAVKRMGLEAVVRFWGFLPHGQVLDLYRSGQVQLCVLPSIRTSRGEQEGIPVSLMEALSFGIPVVATRTGAIDELIEDQVNGILVQPEDSLALADAIQSLLDDPDKRRRFGESGLATIRRRFDVEANALELLELIG